MTCRQLRGLRRVAPARPISAIVLFAILVAASCHATNGARAADDSTPALLAIAGMLDSLCRAWQADCHSFRRRSEEHTSELQSRLHLVCRLLLEKKKPSPNDPSSHFFNALRDPLGSWIEFY